MLYWLISLNDFWHVSETVSSDADGYDFGLVVVVLLKVRVKGKGENAPRNRVDSFSSTVLFDFAPHSLAETCPC